MSGYRNDGDAGLMHVGARYYDAQVGRFISRDTYLDQNPYLYCEHDPVNAVDPSGHQQNVMVGGDGRVYVQGPGWGDPYYPVSKNEGDRLTLLRPSSPDQIPGNDLLRGSNPDPSSGGGDDLLRGGDDPSKPKNWIPIVTPPLVVAVAFVAFVILCCFDGDTPVEMADGTSKKIKDVQEGEWVLSCDIRTGITVPVRVVHVTISDTNATVTLTLPNGERIKTTPNHLFYAPDKGFLSAGAMTAGAQCTLASGGNISVSKISGSKRHQRVYNLAVDGSHTFLVGMAKMVVHDITQLW